MHKYTCKQLAANCIAILLLIVAGYCAYLLLDNHLEKEEQREAFRWMAEKVVHVESEETTNIIPIPETKSAEQLLGIYQELYDLNPDFVGWIRIHGTDINYPVMQTPDNPNFYLRRNFNREYSNLGTPYVQENCDISTCDNLIIYGHHMLDGGMFSSLEKYKKKEFWENHKYVRFDTLANGIGTYEIMAVVVTTAYQPDSFEYYNYVDNNEAAFNEYVSECNARALYNTDVDANYGDKLITLSTCEYSNDNGRLIVVAKKIEEDNHE